MAELAQRVREHLIGPVNMLGALTEQTFDPDKHIEYASALISAVHPVLPVKAGVLFGNILSPRKERRDCESYKPDSLGVESRVTGLGFRIRNYLPVSPDYEVRVGNYVIRKKEYLTEFGLCLNHIDTAFGMEEMRRTPINNVVEINYGKMSTSLSCISVHTLTPQGLTLFDRVVYIELKKETKEIWTHRQGRIMHH